MYKPYFESQELTFMAAVLERACVEAGIVEEREREIVAARIVRVAQTGEEDFETLKERATKSDYQYSFESLHAETSEEPLFRRSFSKLLELSAA